MSSEILSFMIFNIELNSLINDYLEGLSGWS